LAELLAEPCRTRHQPPQVTGPHQRLVGLGRQVATGEGQSGQRQGDAPQPGAHRDPHRQIKLGLVQPAGPVVGLREKGHESVGRAVDRIDAVVNGNVEHAPASAGWQPVHHRDEVIG